MTRRPDVTRCLPALLSGAGGSELSDSPPAAETPSLGSPVAWVKELVWIVSLPWEPGSLRATALCSGSPTASSSLLRPGSDSVSLKYLVFHRLRETWEHDNTSFCKDSSARTVKKSNWLMKGDRLGNQFYYIKILQRQPLKMARRPLTRRTVMCSTI